mgnify:CR=1 FL=1
MATTWVASSTRTDRGERGGRGRGMILQRYVRVNRAEQRALRTECYIESHKLNTPCVYISRVNACASQRAIQKLSSNFHVSYVWVASYSSPLTTIFLFLSSPRSLLIQWSCSLVSSLPLHLFFHWFFFPPLERFILQTFASSLTLSNSRFVDYSIF